MGDFSFSNGSKILKAKASAIVTTDEEKESWLVPEDPEDNRYQHSTCGKRCFVVTAVALFLFLTFLALPGGSFLIIHGRHEGSLPFLLGGGAVVCLPILAGIILIIVFCIRRHRRKATFTSVSSARV